MSFLAYKTFIRPYLYENGSVKVLDEGFIAINPEFCMDLSVQKYSLCMYYKGLLQNKLLTSISELWYSTVQNWLKDTHFFQSQKCSKIQIHSVSDFQVWPGFIIGYNSEWVTTGLLLVVLRMTGVRTYFMSVGPNARDPKFESWDEKNEWIPTIERCCEW